MALSKFIPHKLLPPGAEVKDYETKVLGLESRPTYQAIKNKFVVDKSSPKDSRFILSEMVHSNLSVEAEEERRFNERLKSEVARLHDEIKTKAFTEGMEEGLSQGLKKAYEEEKSRLAVLIEGLAQVLSSISNAKESLAKDYETRLVQLAYKIATVVVDHEIVERPEAVTFSIRTILERISQEEDVRIHISTQDHKILGQFEEELKNISHRGRISFSLDPNLKSGDCVVESASGEIASIIEEKLKKLKEELGRIYPGLETDSNTKTGT